MTTAKMMATEEQICPRPDNVYTVVIGNINFVTKPDMTTTTQQSLSPLFTSIL